MVNSLCKNILNIFGCVFPVCKNGLPNSLFGKGGGGVGTSRASWDKSHDRVSPLPQPCSDVGGGGGGPQVGRGRGAGPGPGGPT